MYYYNFRYPVILSIEDNCSVPQQRNMASTMIEVFGEMLLTQPIDLNEIKMPSPEQLMNKFIIKHRRLPENVIGDQAVKIRHRDDSKSYICLIIFVYFYIVFLYR
jgi:phosphatidylinositol phospholipase C gamma-1